MSSVPCNSMGSINDGKICYGFTGECLDAIVCKSIRAKGESVLTLIE